LKSESTLQSRSWLSGELRGSRGQSTCNEVESPLTRMTPIRCAVESVAKIEDPGTFIVKTTKLGSRSAAYNSAGFGEAWRMAIQCYLPEIRTPTAKLSRACGLKGPIASGMS
jgi:hypothetical protein